MMKLLVEQVRFVAISLAGALSGSLPDMLIAATAQHHNLTLVTRNTRDFEGCGIGLLSPFTD